MAKYDKKFLSYEKQADQYIKRGLKCDKNELIATLKRIGYYRLSGYLYPYRIKDEKYKKGTSLEHILNIYKFDKELRLIIFNAIEEFEIYIRTQLAHELSRYSGAFGFQHKKSLPRLKNKEYKDFIKKCKAQYKSSKEEYINHFKAKYKTDHSLPPYWMLVGILDFGSLTILYKGASPEVRTTIARSLKTTTKVLESWLWTLNYIRNICAHHGRLWNRVIAIPPKEQNKLDEKITVPIYKNRIAYVIEILKLFRKAYSRKKSDWEKDLNKLFKKYPNIDKSKMGYPNI